MYGWSCFLAKLDGVAAPPHPKCIGRIHLYSDMWRHFDNGLYLFMQKYIYRYFYKKTSPCTVMQCIKYTCLQARSWRLHRTSTEASFVGCLLLLCLRLAWWAICFELGELRGLKAMLIRIKAFFTWLGVPTLQDIQYTLYTVYYTLYTIQCFACWVCTMIRYSRHFLSTIY